MLWSCVATNVCVRVTYAWHVTRAKARCMLRDLAQARETSSVWPSVDEIPRTLSVSFSEIFTFDSVVLAEMGALCVALARLVAQVPGSIPRALPDGSSCMVGGCTARMPDGY